jgi:molybdate transport system substrate-binding protein
MISQLGVADIVGPKLLIKAAIHGGGDLVAKGEADVGMYPLSEIQSIKGIEVAGLLPPALQFFVIYGSAVPADSNTPEAAIAFVNYIADPSKAPFWKIAGFELKGQ